MKDKVEIGRLIQEARKKKGYTQIQLAEKLNVSNKAVSHWEKGRYYPDYEYFDDIAKELGINLNEYFKIEDKSPKKNIKKILNIIFSLILILLTIYFINNYNQFALYKITLDSENITLNDSYITRAGDNLVINLGELENKDYLYQPTYKLTLFYNKTKLISLDNYNNLTYQINDKKIINNLENLHIAIEYKYFNTSKKNIDINFKLNKINNSKKINNSSINQSQENLLINNGYSKISTNIYIKQNKESKYKYEINSNILKYQDKNTAISYDGQNIKYIIVKNEEIIEEYTGNSDEHYRSFDKMRMMITSEYNKIILEN